MKKLFLSFVLILSVFSSAFASQGVAPAACPSAQALRSAGLIEGMYEGIFMGVNSGAYDTNTLWAFAIMVPDATSTDDALTKARAALPSLTGPVDGPTLEDDSGESTWICRYQLAQPGYQAVAATFRSQ